jgi:hypothetical protein
MPFQTSIAKDLRKLILFGSGVGIEIGAGALEVVATRVRPTKIQVLGRLTIVNYADRPAAEWGAEYARFLKSMGMSHLSATVLLPRREVIVRQLSLPGIAARDIEGAIRFQLDTLHPYGDEDVVWGWSPLAYGSVLVGIVRRETMEAYRQLLTEAGIAAASFTFSAAAVHAAIRVNGAGHSQGFVALGRSGAGGVEVYGESPSRPVFSAEFNVAPQRAASLALAELRLPPDTAALTLEEVLPKPAVNPVENDLSRNALPYATALAGACPRLAPSANVLPPEHRRASSRAALVPTLVLAGVVLLVGAAVALWSPWSERRYLKAINAEIARLNPMAQRSLDLDRQISHVRAQTELLDSFRAQTRKDLDALQELTRIIEPPAWTNTVDLNRDTVRITGEAPAAPALVRILDSSPLFGNSVPDAINRANNGGTGETFVIHATRKVAR